MCGVCRRISVDVCGACSHINFICVFIHSSVTVSSFLYLRPIQVYEEIAYHFSDTRHKPWPRIAEFLVAQEAGSILLDIGCGNGKYFGVNSRLWQVTLAAEMGNTLVSTLVCGR